ncbi:PREDICTED: uncharacterized protein LOC104592772 isoform X2 [Nelumbo nucifera]|nr:PREDICTED: uncharacterized protein LOC104592772 isoform X2 [Nelumbo nucifera]XP_010250573.1 PREDICTED: uncharacterized protein LOC104592772 isoform X2 [Nelumbo nucifera]XP_010250582.1 PREDICTED: uncharacterized protein LOC104592772 isoform X2 [Nelumbo nucifera]
MLLGIEKKRKEEEELESTYSLRSEVSEMDDRGVSTSESCKDVDIVSVRPECSASTTMGDALASDMASDRRFREHSLANSRTRSQEDSSLDYDSGHDSASVSSSTFEFQKAERAPHRVPYAPFSKPAPSKWDDAQKWIASPTSNRPKSGQPQVPAGQVVGSKKTGLLGYGSRPSATKVVLEVPDQRSVSFEEADTKQMDPSQAKREAGGQKFINWMPEPYPVADSCVKPELIIENSVADSSISLSRHDSSISIHSATTFLPPPSTVRSVSMRDMGTEMTPIASQEPSRTGTPVRATTPIRSPNSSRPSTPGRAAPSSPVEPTDCQLDPNKKELSEKEIQMRTRREIMILGTQLGKMNIAAWASKEEEDNDASTSLKTVPMDKPAKSVIETRATAWEEAEKAKYMARYKREEIKIQAWENHQKAKTEAEMRKIEVEVERMRGRAHDKLMNKLAAARHKAEEKRAAAEAKRNRQAAKTEQQAEYIRRTGRIPSSFSCCSWCC